MAITWTLKSAFSRSIWKRYTATKATEVNVNMQMALPNPIHALVGRHKKAQSSSFLLSRSARDKNILKWDSMAQRFLHIAVEGDSNVAASSEE